jgi:hypothetical protein
LDVIVIVLFLERFRYVFLKICLMAGDLAGGACVASESIALIVYARYKRRTGNLVAGARSPQI